LIFKDILVFLVCSGLKLLFVRFYKPAKIMFKNTFPGRFFQWAQCKPTNYGYVPWRPGDLTGFLVDHGFIVDQACVWSNGDLEGSEIAIISRTYCSDDELDNPPKGLRCWRLPVELIGDDPGTGIATVITAGSPAADAFLRMSRKLPADMMAYAIPKAMRDKGFALLLIPDGANGINPKIVKKAPG
jgi:hypothetical protein